MSLSKKQRANKSARDFLAWRERERRAKESAELRASFAELMRPAWSDRVWHSNPAIGRLSGMVFE